MTKTKIPGHQDGGQKKASRTPVIVAAAVIAVVAIAAIIAVVASRGGDSSSADKTLSQYQNITVTGSPLPVLPDSGDDPAVGTKAPTIVGKSFDGSAVAIEPGKSGKPMLVLFVAHWCPHCQREVPLLADWINSGKAPKNLEIVTVSTSATDTRPNWPPSAWLKKESWVPPVLVDDPENGAATAYGLPGFPYFVVLEADGTVSARTSGEQPITEVERLVTAAGAS